MLKPFLEKLLKIEATIAAIAFFLAASAVLIDVIGREIFDQGIWGSAKFAVFCAVTAGFLGIGIATDAGMQLRPRFADGIIPSTLEPAMRRIAPLLSSCLFFIAGWYAMVYVHETYQFGQAAPVLEFPLWMIQVVMPYAFISNGIRNLIYAIEPDLTPEPSGIF